MQSKILGTQLGTLSNDVLVRMRDIYFILNMGGGGNLILPPNQQYC